MADGRFERLSGSVFPEFRSPTAGNPDTGVVSGDEKDRVMAVARRERAETAIEAAWR